MNLVVKNAFEASWNGRPTRCAVGKGGIVTPEAKQEGDGATPAGIWPMRQVLYRADRLPDFKTRLPARALDPGDGWCEVPSDPNYNTPIRHPYPKADRMWRADNLYDVIVVLGYNDDPVVPGKGSAIFLHLMRPDFGPSAGCVTLALEDILTVLREAVSGSCVEVLLP